MPPSAARIALCSPVSPPEAGLLDTGVAAELDDHEVGGGGEEGAGEVLRAAEGADRHRRLLRGAAGEDLRRVEIRLRVERRELRTGPGPCQTGVRTGPADVRGGG